jgi:glycosyltransferase involved in cell wall biosynthesis
MNAQPRVSVIIDNYNYGRFLGDAIDSVLNQTYRNLEVVVVDDGSIDHSHEVIEGYDDKVISVLKSNGGQASAFNAGFAASQGEIVCFLDADDIMLPTRVATAVQVFTDYPDAQWSYHQLGLMDEGGKPYETNNLDLSIRQVVPFDLRQDMQRGNLKRLPYGLPGIVGITFRRSHLAQILPMPESDGLSLNDSYIHFASCALSPGVAFPTQLEWQRIHGNNGFTQRRDRQPLNARIHLLTGYWLRKNYPQVSRYADNLFAIGVGLSWRYGASELSRSVMQTYLAELTPTETLSVTARSLFRALKG